MEYVVKEMKKKNLPPLWVRLAEGRCHYRIIQLRTGESRIEVKIRMTRSAIVVLEHVIDISFENRSSSLSITGCRLCLGTRNRQNWTFHPNWAMEK